MAEYHENVTCTVRDELYTPPLLRADPNLTQSLQNRTRNHRLETLSHLVAATRCIIAQYRSLTRLIQFATPVPFRRMQLHVQQRDDDGAAATATAARFGAVLKRFPVRVCVTGGGSSVSGSPTTGYLGGMGGGGGGHTPGSSSPGSEMSPQHNESPPAPSWPGEMKHHPHPHAPPHSHHHPHTAGHHPPPPPPPPHHAGYMPQYSWYQADPNPGLLT